MIRRSLSDRSLRACAGFHLFELVIVLAVIGVLLAMAYPRFRGFETRRETRNAVAAVAGVLQRAREDAIKTGVPHLVVVKPPAAGGGGSCPGGGDPAKLQVVRDNDSSYSATPGDVVADVDVDGLDDCSVALYGEGSDATPFPDLAMPSEDVGSTAQSIAQSLAGIVGGLTGGLSGSGSSGSGSNSGSGSSGSGSSGSGSSGSGSSGSGSSGSGSSGSGSGSSGSGSGGLAGLVGGVAGAAGGAISGVTSVVGSTIGAAVASGGAAAGMTHGSTLPLGDDGLPVAAFTPAGWAVDPSTPGSAGSGSGAIYVTDGENAVYAAVVQPLGRVLVRGYDAANGAWK